MMQTFKTEIPAPHPVQATTPQLSILVITPDRLSGDSICTAISLGGLGCSGQIVTLQEATQVAETGRADVVLIALPMSGLTTAMLTSIYANLQLPIVLMGDQIDVELVEKCSETGVFGCVSVATPPAVLSSTLLLAARRHASRSRLEGERDQLADQTRQLLATLENRKIIERAKGIYMRVLGLAEAEAHRRLQQESQRRRLAIADLARKIIESDDLLAPSERPQFTGRNRGE